MTAALIILLLACAAFFLFTSGKVKLPTRPQEPKREPIPLPKLASPLKSGHLRNQPCPCDSGKKYKRCCWDSQENAVDLDKFLQAKAFLELREKAE